MKKGKTKVVIMGAGSIGTSVGNIIVEASSSAVIIHSIEKDVVNDINLTGINRKYFPAIHLHPDLKASVEDQILSDADVIFLAIPSVILVDYLESVSLYIKPETLLVNLAKGFGSGHKTITRCLRERLPNHVLSLKGPSFAREIIYREPTGLTLGYEFENDRAVISQIFQSTPITLDHTTDVEGVEILSILKNIYAIAFGIVDAHFNSPNLRFLVLTRAFKEMRDILLSYHGEEKTLFNYCGFGDFTLTALNDMSRNRTLGLLIGKGFFTEHVSHDLVLEGKNAVNIFYEEISKTRDISIELPIIAELYKILNGAYDIQGFLRNIMRF